MISTYCEDKEMQSQSRDTAIWVGGRGQQTANTQRSQVVQHMSLKDLRCEISPSVQCDVSRIVVIIKALGLAVTVGTPENLSKVRRHPANPRLTFVLRGITTITFNVLDL